MKASKNYGECFCGCKNLIKRGTEFQIVDGVFYIDGHEPKGSPKKKNKNKSNSKSKKMLNPTKQQTINSDSQVTEPTVKYVGKPKVTPNGLISCMLAQQIYTDDDIVRAVMKEFPARPVRRIRIDITSKRDQFNKGNLKKYVKAFNPVLPIKRLSRIDGKLVEAITGEKNSYIPDNQPVPSPALVPHRGLRRMQAPATPPAGPARPGLPRRKLFNRNSIQG